MDGLVTVEHGFRCLYLQQRSQVSHYVFVDGLKRGRANQVKAGDESTLTVILCADARALEGFYRDVVEEALEPGGDFGQNLWRHATHGQGDMRVAGLVVEHDLGGEYAHEVCVHGNTVAGDFGLGQEYDIDGQVFHTMFEPYPAQESSHLLTARRGLRYR